MPLGDRELLVEAAAHCDDCLGWLEHCEAECCQMFTFSLTPRSDVAYAEDTVRIHAPVTPDGKRYYELHGAHVDGDFITVPRSACAVFATRLVVTMPCRALGDDRHCSLHDDGQPDCCAGFTWETACQDDWVLTPRCLFAYRREAARRGSRPADSESL